MTAWLALSLTVQEKMIQSGLAQVRRSEAGKGDAKRLGMESKGANVPFPFDHFFFCFLPADAAAGA